MKYTDPPSALGFWFALEKCTSENGALPFLPGSHKTAPITKRFIRLPQGGTGFEELIPASKTPAPPEGKYILEPCEPGMLVENYFFFFTLPLSHSFFFLSLSFYLLSDMFQAILRKKLTD